MKQTVIRAFIEVTQQCLEQDKKEVFEHHHHHHFICQKT